MYSKIIIIIIKIKLNDIGIFILEVRVKENHQEHNVARPKEIIIEVEIELNMVIKTSLKFIPKIPHIVNMIKKGIKMNPNKL